jgi:carboxymethylenebutenolidase
MGEWVDFPVGKKTSEGYLAMPEGGTPPGVLLLHAWWGLNPFFKSLVDRFAAERFIVLAPDLYGGQVAETIEDAQRLRAESNKGPVTRSALLTGALDFLKRRTGDGPTKLGIVGFSMGAHWTMWLAANQPQGVAAVVLFYGTRQVDPAQSRAAFMGHFAESDPYVAGKAVAETEKTLKSAGRSVQFYIYAGTGHWFFEEDRRDAFNPEAAHLAWDRTVQFLHEKLG